MRYWIYWNDLVQGPFEIEELLTLKAFRADLLVCEEEHEEWTPAAALPELAQHLAVAMPTSVGPVPPPPPPQPPSLTPLQGEFFNESVTQQPLFDLNGSKNYAFRPVEEAPAAFLEDAPSQVTMPFRFAVILPPWITPSPESPPLPEYHKPEAVEDLKPASYPILEEQPVRSEIVPAWTEEPLPEFAEDRAEVPVAIPLIESPQVIVPSPELKPPTPRPPVELPKPQVKAQPLWSPPVIQKPASTVSPIDEQRATPEKIAFSKAPVLDEAIPSESEARLWPWLLGAIASLGIIGGALFTFMSHSPATPPAISHSSQVSPTSMTGSQVPEVTPPLVQNLPKPEKAKQVISAPMVGSQPPDITHSPLQNFSKPENAGLSITAIKPSLWKILDQAGAGQGPLVSPAGVAVSPQGEVWVAERNTSRLYKYDASNQQWTVVGQPGQKIGEFSSPTGVAVSPSGQVWVADQGNNRMQVYTPGTNTWITVGQQGQKTGEFDSPTGVAVSPSGQVWVADQGNNRLQMYDLATNQWKSVGQKGQAAGHFKSPNGVAVDAKGHIWVSDTGNSRVQRYDPATQHWSVVGKQGTSRGAFKSPSGVAVTAAGEVWVTDTGNNRLQTYDATSRHWGVVGLPGQAAGEFNSPMGLSVGSNGQMWVADEGNNRLQTAKVGALVHGLFPIVGTPLHSRSNISKIAKTSEPHKATPTPKPVPVNSQSGKDSSISKVTPPVALPLATPVPGVSGGSPSPSAEPVDPWRGREQEAISIALQQKLYGGQRTVGTNAKLMLEDMHEKELLHAADTGERLYMPDKISWSALHETGPRYRVYLNFMAWQANGERIQARSDQFLVDLDKKAVSPADESTHHDFFDETAKLHHQHSPKADDIESVLSAVDAFNRQKLRAVILKSDKDDKKSVQNGLQVASAKLQRMIIYFRTKYAEVTLQNIAKAYMFEMLLKGK